MKALTGCNRLLASGVALAAALSPAAPALAQSQTASASQTDPVPVIIWTFVVACLAMLVLSLGYLYRRARGAQDELIPQNVDMYYEHEGELEKHGTGEIHPELPPVPEQHATPTGTAHGNPH